MTAPVDPRTELPPFGALPVVAAMDELADRVVAPNPSAMTLDGTNTYVIGDRRGTDVVLVDPGPDDDAHLVAVQTVLRDRGAEPCLILLTHHHIDHVEAARSWADMFECPIAAATPGLCHDAPPLSGGASITAAGLSIDVVATPGHTADHMSFRLPTGALLTGDHILGRGTSVVADPDGNLTDYLASLRRVLDISPDAILPGHGPAMLEDPSAVVRFYLAHREHRLDQILAVLGDGDATAGEIVEVVYAAYDPGLWGAAEASTRAGLDVLQGRGQVKAAKDGEFRLM